MVRPNPPPLLAKISKWLEQQEYGELGYFEVELGRVDDARSPRLAAECAGFLRMPEGSLVVLVPMGKDQSWGVGYLGSEGETDSLASSLEAFLHAWSKGESGVSELDDEECTGRSKLKAWLKKQAVKVPKANGFDFDAYLDDDPVVSTKRGTPRAKSAPAARKLCVELSPKLTQLARLMGRTAEDPEVVAFVTKTLGKKLPASTTDMSDSKHVTAPKHGMELVFSHSIQNDVYPPISKTKSSFLPYLSFVFLEKKLGEPLPDGLDFGISGKELESKLAKNSLWTRFRARFELPLDESGNIRFHAYNEDEAGYGLAVRSALELSKHGVPPRTTVGVFVAWSILRGLLDRSRFAAHESLIQAIAARKKPGSALVDAALPRGLWDDHLVDKPGLRLFAYEYFHNMGKHWIDRDFCKVFGKRKGPHGHDEPKLDDDEWDKVDKATPLLDKQLAAFLE